MSLPITDKDNPKPCVLSTLTLYLRGLKDKDGKPYDLSGVSKFYAHIKAELSDADGSAAVALNSVSNPTQFVTTYASTGNLDIIFTTTNTNLTPGTTYYLDVKAVWTGGTAIPLVVDTIVFQTPATKATS